MSGLITNVLSRFFFTIHFVTSSLIHIRQKEKIAPEIAVKVTSVNGPLRLENCPVPGCGVALR